MKNLWIIALVGLIIALAVDGSNAQEQKKPLNAEYVKLVEQLGDPSYAVREQAYAKLIGLGLSARAEVTAALDSPDPEVRDRARQLIERLILGEYLLQNPGEIVSMNLSQARILMDKSPKLKYLDLGGLKSIDKEVARELAGSTHEWLRLNGLVAIDKDIARELAKFEGKYLALRGLKSIDKDVARELGGFTGHLDLYGLKSIDKAVAQGLAKFGGKRLGLIGLESIDKEVAQELVKIKGVLSLRGLKSMDKDVAKELAKFSGIGGVSLYSLKSIDKDVAQELAKWKGKYLCLNSLEFIDKATAQELAKFESRCMYLQGLNLEAIDKDILEILMSNSAIALK